MVYYCKLRRRKAEDVQCRDLCSVDVAKGALLSWLDVAVIKCPYRRQN